MSDLFCLKGKVALVTGASSGLGVQFAKALANQGASIVAVARRQNLIDAVADEISKEYGVRTLAVKSILRITTLPPRREEAGSAIGSAKEGQSWPWKAPATLPRR